jgi:ureidoglycolate dehydrogenase (NAD+)
MLPFGQHKGYGIALLIEMLSGVLAGATVAPNVGNLYDNPTGVQNVGHGFGAIRVDALAPSEEFAARMDALIREVRQSPRGAGVPRIYLPGEIEFELAERNRREGLALAEPTVQELAALGARLGLACPF